MDERRGLLRVARELQIGCLMLLDERGLREAIRRARAGQPAFESPSQPAPTPPAAPLRQRGLFEEEP